MDSTLAQMLAGLTGGETNWVPPDRGGGAPAAPLPPAPAAPAPTGAPTDLITNPKTGVTRTRAEWEALGEVFGHTGRPGAPGSAAPGAPAAPAKPFAPGVDPTYGTQLFGPAAVITPSFRHLFTQAQNDQFGRGDAMFYGLDKEGNLIETPMPWKSPSAAQPATASAAAPASAAPKSGQGSAERKGGGAKDGLPGRKIPVISF